MYSVIKKEIGKLSSGPPEEKRWDPKPPKWEWKTFVSMLKGLHWYYLPFSPLCYFYSWKCEEKLSLKYLFISNYKLVWTYHTLWFGNMIVKVSISYTKWIQLSAYLLSGAHNRKVSQKFKCGNQLHREKKAQGLHEIGRKRLRDTANEIRREPRELKIT